MTILTEMLIVSLVFTLSSSQTDIWVGRPPKMVKGPPKNRIYKSGDNITLECKATGIPDVTYEWKTNGSQTIHNGSEGTITLINATSMDEGFYQCFARNRYGTALSNTTHLQRVFLESTSESPIVVNITVSEGQQFNISCDQPRSFPKPTYAWEIVNDTQDEYPIRLQPRKLTRIDKNGDLHFGYAMLDDELKGKLYRCAAYNSYLGQFGVHRGRTYTRLTVATRLAINFDSPAADRSYSPTIKNTLYSTFETNTPGSPTVSPTTPIMTEAPQHPCDNGKSPHNYGFATNSIVGLIGGSVAMQCLFYAKPEDLTQISWLRHSPAGSSLPIGRYTLDAFNTTLTINNITASDDGIYRCEAGHGCGLGVTLNVEAVPTFPTENDAPSDVSVIEGESYTFNCNPVGNPAAQIVWLRNGKELDPDNPPRRFEFTNNNRSLTIRDLCRDCVDRETKTDLMVIQCNASNVHGYAFAQAYLIVLKKYCDNDVDEKHSVVWNRTSVGEHFSQSCPVNTTGSCSRKCLLNTTWYRPNYNGCFSNKFRDLLDEGFNAEENDTVLAEIASQMSAMTNTSEGLSAGNLNASVMLMTRLAVQRSDDTRQPSEKEIKAIFQAASNLLGPNNSDAWKDLQDVDKNIAASVLSTLDVYGRSFSMLNTPDHKIQEDSFVLEAWSLGKSDLPLQLEFPTYSAPSEKRKDELSLYVESQNSSIPSESQPALNMWGVHYSTIDKYLPGKKDSDDVINSKVLSFSIGGLDTNEALRQPVLITLQHNKEIRRLFRRTCAFWNFDRGDWDSFGCSVTSTNKTHTICSCDHLTNFAILMSRKPVKDDLLSLISIICCSISVASLILTAAVYVVTWKHAISSQAALLLNLCIALIIAYTIFMAGADKFDSNLYSTVGCKVVAILLHYFFLVAFFIMLAEGIDMVLYIFFVFHVRRKRETIMLVASAWVAPLIIVGVSLGVTRLDGYGHNEACWLSVENGLIWAFIGPVMCIIAVNLVILIIILRLISQKKALLATTSKTRDEIRATIWNLSVMCPVLGIGWLFGVFSVSFDHVVFQYLFVIANSLHGLLIFIIYALLHNKKMNEKISSVYSKYIGFCRRTDPNVSNKMTSSQDQSTSSTSNTQMTLAQEQSTNSTANTQMTSAQEQSTSSTAHTKMTSAQEQSTSSTANTQMTSAQEQSTSSTSNTQMTSAQKQPTRAAAPGYVVLATTQITSTPEQCTSPKPDSLPHIQVTLEPEPQSPSATVVYRTVCWETMQIFTEEQLLNIDDSDKFASTYESERGTIYSEQQGESDDDAREI